MGVAVESQAESWTTHQLPEWPLVVVVARVEPGAVERVVRLTAAAGTHDVVRVAADMCGVGALVRSPSGAAPRLWSNPCPAVSAM